jgi:uncharacterized repeat protein (TIGR03803 family)
MKAYSRSLRAGLVGLTAFLYVAAPVQSQQASPIVVLHRFTGGSDSQQPINGLTQIIGGNLMGATAPSSVNAPTTLFELSPNRSVTTIWASPIEMPPEGTRKVFTVGRVLAASDGNFYVAGESADGDPLNPGEIAKFDTAGNRTAFHLFNSAEGPPSGGLVEGFDGHFYGVAAGSPPPHYAVPKVYRIYPAGIYAPIATLANQNAGGTLTVGSDGDFYGVTVANGATGGMVYRVATSGVLQVLHVFTFQDGSNPNSGLAEISEGVFLGTTYDGGTHNLGTIFQITRDGQFSSLYSFDGTKGQNPSSGLLLASDGNLYGTTAEVLDVSLGTIYQFAPGGQLTSFPMTVQTGYAPGGDLIQTEDGAVLGVALYGGASPDLGGTVYALELGLPKPLPAILGFQPASGGPGAVVTIRGNYFIHASAVQIQRTECPIQD